MAQHDDKDEAKKLREARTKAQLVDADIADAINALLRVRNGQRFLWWLLQIGRYGTQPFARNGLDMAFNCGELNVGQKIADRIISTNAEGFLRMQEQELNDERSPAHPGNTSSTGSGEAGTAADADADPFANL